MLVAELDLRDELLAPNGYLHAASVIALADTACGYGCLAHLPDGATSFTTIELKSNFLGTARDGTLSCIARPAHLGRNTQVWDATVARKADGGHDRAVPLHADGALAEGLSAGSPHARGRACRAGERDRRSPLQSIAATSVALPPAAVVLTVTVRSTTSRAGG